MILHGNQRGGGRQMALHLLNVDSNEHVDVHEISGFASDDILGALNEAYAISKATKCKQFMYSASFNPPMDANVPIEVFVDAINRAEKKLKLAGQPRVIVFHEKEGRRHAHCVWSRIDAESMTAINISHPKLKLKSLSKELFHEQGWDMPKGLIDRGLKNPLNFTHEEWEQAQRTQQHPRVIKEALHDAWQFSDSKKALEQALQDRGYYLARGDRRSFVVVDLYGEVYSLPRKIGLKKADVEARIGAADELRSVDDTKALISDRLTKQFVEYHNDLESQHKRQISSLDSEKRVMRDRHRSARRILEDQQNRRWQREELSRSLRLRSGFKGIWDKLTGSYQRTRARNEEETRKSAHKLEVETHQLITDQLNERRGLQNRFDQLRGQHIQERAEFVKGINRHYERNEQQDEVRELLSQLRADQEREALNGEFNAQQLPLHKADPDQPLVIPSDPEELSLRERVKRNPEAIIEAICDKKESFTGADISRALGKFVRDENLLAGATEQVLTSKALIQIESGEKPLYSTHEMQRVKASIKEHAATMSATKGHGMPEAHQKWAIEKHNALLQQKAGADLSKEQRTAINHLTSDEQLNMAVGLAGTGKSTLLAATNDAWRKQGRRVFGAAISGKAADGLQDASNIESRTLASWQLSWKNGYSELQKGDVFVIDEAGMVGNRQMLKFMKYVKEKEAKLVLVGDPEQLQPINAGTPLKELTQKIEHARLAEIRRQKEDWQRHASLDLAESRTQEAIATYAKRGAVYETNDKIKAITKLVGDYLQDWDKHGDNHSRIALAYRRKDVHMINQFVRSARKQSGQLTEEKLFQTDHGPRKFGYGERIVFTRNDKDLGVRNGLLATIQSATDKKITVQFDAEGKEKPRTLTFKPDQYSGIDHGYATTIHKSQGVTVDRSFVLSDSQVDKHLTYVAMTRHKESAKLYIDTSSAYSRRHLHEQPLKQPKHGPSLEI